MSGNIIIRTDLENIVSGSADEFENNLLQELDELISVDEQEEELRSFDSTDEDEDICVIDEEAALENYDRNYVEFDNVELQPNSSQKRTLYLTEEEQDIINNCTDPTLKQLLILNRSKSVHIKELCKNLYRVYDELDKNHKKERKKYLEKEIKKEDLELQSMAKTYVWRVGIPFFKDKSFYAAAPNEDLARKKGNKEFYATKLVEGPKWMQEEQRILRESVLGSYFKYKTAQLEQNIRVLNNFIKNETDETAKAELLLEVDNLKEKLDTHKSKSRNDPPPINSKEGIDWLKIASFDLKGRHTYMECEAFWNIYLHPSINKTDWTAEENEKIKELAVTYNFDWEVIAKELNTNRSAFLVCVHYNTKLCDKFKRERFLPEEDEFLQEVVENCRMGDYIPWGRVAYYFDDRSKHQLYHRYRYYLSPKDVRKGTFTEAEDILLTHLTERFGKDFSRISELIPQRTSIQLRNRYSSYLEKLNHVQLGNYSFADDKKILHHVDVHGEKNWSDLATQLKRTRAHVRQRYLTLTKYIKKNPELKIESLPRRKQPFLSSCQVKRQSRMIACLEKLKQIQGIPTLTTVETFIKQIECEVRKKEKQWRVLKTPVRKPPSETDRKLIEFFKGSCKFQRETKTLAKRVVNESARRIIKLFDALGADIDMLKEAEIKEDCYISEQDNEILNCIKNLLQESKADLIHGKNSFVTDKDVAALPGPSQSDPSVLNLPKPTIKHLLPPCVNTLLGIRGMIFRYQVFKDNNRNLPSIVKVNSTKTAPPDPMAWKIEQNLLQYDPITRSNIKDECEIFYKRLHAALKWPCIMSDNFPEHLMKKEEEEESQKEDVIEEQQEKRKVGRPSKKAYAKVMKMVEARKRKINESCTVADEPDGTNESTPSCSGSSGPTRSDANNEAIASCYGKTTAKSSEINEAPKKKPRRGRPPNKSKSEHAVLYIPRRSHVKINKTNEVSVEEEEGEIMDVDEPESDGTVSNGPVNVQENNGTKATVKGNNINQSPTRKGTNVKTFAADNSQAINPQIKENITTSATGQKIINLSDIKLLNSNAVMVKKDEISKLMKLDQFKNAKKIVVVQGAKEKYIINGDNIPTVSKKVILPDASHIEHPQTIPPEATPNNANKNSIHNYPRRSRHQNGKSFKISTEINKNKINQELCRESQQNGHVEKAFIKHVHFEKNQSPSTHSHQNNHLSSSKTLCIDKDLWDDYRNKWRNLDMPKTTKAILEEDLTEIELEAETIAEETNREENESMLDEDLHTMFDVKGESDSSEESDIDIPNISKGATAKELFDEFDRICEDEDDDDDDNDEESCLEEVRAAIEKSAKESSIKLSTNIEKMRKKLKQKNN